ncbi:MAG: carbonic anhydrase [Pyrinomonadaceae bacterium]|nr:carbonic anhydrase [Pyrinomonadaceae bacterium]
MDVINKLINGNREWVEDQLEIDKDYFQRLSQGQEPDSLWIGCADSRVPASEVTRTKPGEMFEHRNIANMVVHSDMNLLSVLDYAVNALRVKHVIVCGHYLCGGINAAMGNRQNGLVDNWIRHIKDVYRLYENELEAIEDKQQRFDRFVEVNVYEQVFDLSKTSIIQNAWAERNEPKIHGWVFDIRTGLIKDLNITFDNQTQLPSIYKIDSEVVMK